MESYILQVIFFQLLFLLVYELLLKKETFFNYNRTYLLITPVLAFILPSINIEILSDFVSQDSVTSISRFWLPEVYMGNSAEYIEQLPELILTKKSHSINWLLILYSIGVIVSLGILGKKCYNLSSLFKFKVISEIRNFKVIQIPSSNIACTFNRTIFIGEDLSLDEREQILAHELIHVQQKHSYDLVFFEILKIIFWFNPLIYIYQIRIAALHEFIADSNVVKTIEKHSYYEQLLNTAFNTQNISFINQFFNHSLIKKRIVMLQKSKSNSISKTKYLVVIPIILAMLTIVACSDNLLSEGDPNLENYNYTLVGGDEKSSDENKEDFWKFVEENPDYVGWRIVDHEKETIEFSIHSKDEDVPEDYKSYEYLGQNGEKRVHYIKEINSDVNTAVATKKDNKSVEGVADVPFALIDQVPLFPGCESLSSNEEQKKCMSQKIQEHVQKNFNANMGSGLGLTGINRVIVQFKINKDGKIADVKARAAHPILKEEGIRVINSLPQMVSGKQNGKAVGVMYSLPIVFQVD